MKRRETLKTIVGGTLGIMLAPPSRAKMDRKRPNIVVILSDDAGYADFGFTGCKDITTPNLDQLAKEGVTCTQGYVTASVCCPSRMGLITGRNQQRFGAECNCPTIPTPEFTNADLGLETTETTIADLLKANGYRTMALGKWHLGEHPQYHPNKRGFDEFYGFLGGGRSYWPSEYAPENPHRILHNYEPVDEQKELTYLTANLADQTISFIETNKENPFFIYLAFNAVHTPMHAPKEYIEQFSSIKNKQRRTYAAMMKSMDDNIGRVLNKLNELGLEKDTLVFFLNDNGGALGNGSNNRPLRGDKGSYWEGGIRVPYLVRWPGHLPAGKKYHHPVSALDILPTALAAAESDVRPPKPLDGVNLLPFLNGKHKQPPHQNLFWRFWRISVCRQGKWKLLKVADDPLKKERKLLLPLQLFDLDKDPCENDNVASQYPEVVAELSGKLESWDSQLQPPRWYDGGGWQKWQEVQIKNHRER